MGSSIHRAQREHRFGLDLVRVVAIVLVLICHCGLAFYAWALVARPRILQAFGYYGVELFFVLSGFLIGGILLDVAQTRPGLRDWLVFMARRWIRTLPIYYVWLAVLVAVWPPNLFRAGWSDVGDVVPMFATFTQNLAWVQPDWFTVSWSLSIEEWFYLTFSIVLLAGARLVGAEKAALAALSVFLFVPALLRLAQPAWADWNEYLHKAVVFRLDAVAFGVAMIFAVRTWRIGRMAACLLFATGCAIIAVQWMDVLPAEALPGVRVRQALFSDVTDFGFVLLLPAMLRVPRPHVLIEFPVRFLASISYGIYLMHYTLIEWIGYARGSTHWSALVAGNLTLALILLLSASSYYGFERPLLGLRPQSRPAPKLERTHSGAASLP